MRWGSGVAGAVGWTIAAAALAAADEIQVYVDDINKPGERGLETHVNYVPIGRKNAEYSGERPPYRVLRITPEISTGLAPGWDAGIYLPGAISGISGSTFFDGPKLRLKHLRFAEHALGTVFYGVNLELSYNSPRISPARWGSELRFIAGIDTEHWLFAINPIFARDLSTPIDGAKTTEFNLSLKAARKLSDGVALGFEHFAESGDIRHSRFGATSSETTYLVLDLERKGWDLNFGIGRGWTAGTSDKLTLKMILAFPL